MKNAATNTKVKGLLVEIDTQERFSTSSRTFIDYGEIDSRIKGIAYISKIDKSVTTLKNFEARYKTKDDFSVTVFNESQDKLSVSVAVGSIGRKQIFLSMDQLPTLLTNLQEAKAALDGL